MPSRQPPTADQFIEIFNDHPSTMLRDTEPYRAVSWEEAVNRARLSLKTTGPRASTWLVAAAADERSPLAALWANNGLKIATQAALDDGVTWRTIDWPAEIHTRVRFNSNGRLLDINSPATGPTSWLVLRSLLPRIREAISEQVHAAAQQRDAAKAAEQAEFTEIHGDDLAVIMRLITRIHPPDTEPWLTDGTVDAGISARTAQFYGTDGRLLISLRGTQITRFADQIRELEGCGEARHSDRGNDAETV